MTCSLTCCLRLTLLAPRCTLLYCVLSFDALFRSVHPAFFESFAYDCVCVCFVVLNTVFHPVCAVLDTFCAVLCLTWAVPCCVSVVFDSRRRSIPHGHKFHTVPTRGRQRAELSLITSTVSHFAHSLYVPVSGPVLVSVSLCAYQHASLIVLHMFPIPRSVVRHLVASLAVMLPGVL